MQSADEIKSLAGRYGVIPGSINPNLFQDQEYATRFRLHDFTDPERVIEQSTLEKYGYLKIPLGPPSLPDSGGNVPRIMAAVFRSRISSNERGQSTNISTDSRLSGDDISSDHMQVVAGGLESLFGIVLRNRPSVVVEGQIALPAGRSKTTSRPACFLSMRERTKSMMAMWWPG